ncbi:MAG: recombinase family protein [Planctomycetes bacterium]|nr:recombinase family protein [Planctomycetota bacterium]
MACYAYKKKFRDPEYRKGGTLALGDKQEVETVKLIYRLYLETDTSGRAIALELNRRGIPSPNGGKWNYGSVRNILVRHAYKGEATWGRLCGSFKTVSGGEVIDSPGARSLKDEADWVIVKCPAIVSVKDWEAVQKKLTSRVTRKTPYVGGVPRGRSPAKCRAGHRPAASDSGEHHVPDAGRRQRSPGGLYRAGGLVFYQPTEAKTCSFQV